MLISGSGQQEKAEVFLIPGGKENVMFIWPVLFLIAMDAAIMVGSFMHVTGIHQRMFSALCVFMDMISYPHPTIEFLLGL